LTTTRLMNIDTRPISWNEPPVGKGWGRPTQTLLNVSK
jgi:hypothetical protein